MTIQKNRSDNWSTQFIKSHICKKSWFSSKCFPFASGQNPSLVAKSQQRFGGLKVSQIPVEWSVIVSTLYPFPVFSSSGKLLGILAFLGFFFPAGWSGAPQCLSGSAGRFGHCIFNRLCHMTLVYIIAPSQIGTEGGYFQMEWNNAIHLVSNNTWPEIWLRCGTNWIRKIISSINSFWQDAQNSPMAAKAVRANSLCTFCQMQHFTLEILVFACLLTLFKLQNIFVKN